MGNTELLEGMIFEYCSCKGSRVSWQEKSAALCQWLSTLAGEERLRIEEYRGTNNYSTALVGGWSAPGKGDEANQQWCHIRDFERHGRSLNEEAE